MFELLLYVTVNRVYSILEFMSPLILVTEHRLVQSTALVRRVVQYRDFFALLELRLVQPADRLLAKCTFTKVILVLNLFVNV